MRRFRVFLAGLAIVGLLAAPAMASSSTSNLSNDVDKPAHPMVDVLLYRPFGLVGLAGATIFFIPAEIITLMVEPSSWREPVHYFLERPAKFVFVDPIGSH